MAEGPLCFDRPVELRRGDAPGRIPHQHLFSDDLSFLDLGSGHDEVGLLVLGHVFSDHRYLILCIFHALKLSISGRPFRALKRKDGSS